MPNQMTAFRVMISAPSDVSEERGIVRDIITQWNEVHAEKQNIVLLTVEWQTHTYPEMGNHTQKIINEQLLKECDLLIGLFWTRLGTPTEDYPSGSAEEISRHSDAKKPVMLYFSNRPVDPAQIDSEQYEKLKQFKENCRKQSLYREWGDISEFHETFHRDLERIINGHPHFRNPDGQSDNLEKDIQRLIGEWISFGEESMSNRLPVHPGYVYRLSGEWQSWNDFLGVKEFDEAYDENLRADLIENEAFKRIQKYMKRVGKM